MKIGRQNSKRDGPKEERDVSPRIVTGGLQTQKESELMRGFFGSNPSGEMSGAKVVV
jgi:hypothetical protein